MRTDERGKRQRHPGMSDPSKIERPDVAVKPTRQAVLDERVSLLEAQVETLQKELVQIKNKANTSTRKANANDKILKELLEALGDEKK